MTTRVKASDQGQSERESGTQADCALLTLQKKFYLEQTRKYEQCENIQSGVGLFSPKNVWPRYRDLVSADI